MLRHVKTLGLVTVALLVVCLPILAEQEEPLMLLVAIALGNEEPVKVQVLEGGMATYKSYAQDVSFGVIPQIRDHVSGEVDIYLVTFTGVRPNYEPERGLGRAHGKLGGEIVTAITSKHVAGIVVTEASRPDSTPGRCAVSCGTVEISGLSIQSTCGTC